MSGHSKWHSIKHKKAATDAKRGKIFTKHAKLITIAAREGGDPDMNAPLRSAIDNAKAMNMPNSNIEKAVKKGTGADKDGVSFMEIMYEGFGPAGAVFYVHSITDNKNRSVAAVKIALTKNGGNMGEAGTVGWMFEKNGVIVAKCENEDAELMAIDAGADDISMEEGVFEIITDYRNLMKVKDALKEKGFEIEKAEISFIPKDTLILDNLEDAKKAIQLMEALEDEEDVAEVYCNFDIAEELLDQL